MIWKRKRNLVWWWFQSGFPLRRSSASTLRSTVLSNLWEISDVLDCLSLGGKILELGFYRLSHLRCVLRKVVWWSDSKSDQYLRSGGQLWETTIFWGSRTWPLCPPPLSGLLSSGRSQAIFYRFCPVATQSFWDKALKSNRSVQIFTSTPHSHASGFGPPHLPCLPFFSFWYTGSDKMPPLRLHRDLQRFTFG